MGRVENKDLFASDVFKKTQEDVKALIVEMDNLEKSFVSVAVEQKKILNQQENKTFESIQKSKRAVEKLTETEKIAIKVKKQKANLEQKLTIATGKNAKSIAELNLQNREQVRLNKTLVNENAKLVGSYQAQTNKLNRLRRSYKDLASAEGTTSKKSKELLKDIQKLDTKLKGIDKSVGQSQRNVGNYASAWSRVGGILKGGLGVLGLAGGIAGLGRVISSSIGIFTSFEKANSGLKAVLNGTDQEMVLLAEDAKRLGSITAFTASEVTSMQTAFARLGFPTEDLLLMTESTLNASSAMGSGLEETASLTGATLKAFGLDASEAGRVNDVLAKSTSASALDFSKLSSAMSTIAPVANSFGFSVEGTTALLGQLSNAGFDASSSATATKNILLNLADSNSKLAKSLKEPVTDLPSLVKGLKQLKGEGIDLGKALKLTDKRSVAAFSTFLEGADDVLALNNELENAGGTAQKMADTQLDNLAGATTILNSAWEGMILSLEDGSGAFSRLLRNIVEVATEILSLLTGTEKLDGEMSKHQKTVRKYAKAFITIVKIVSALVVSFVTYKAVMGATNLITKAYTATTNALKVAQAFLTAGTKGATTAQKSLNASMKANPIGLIITLIAGLITAYLLFRDTTTSAMKAQKSFNEALETGNKIADARIQKQNEQTTETIRMLEEEIRARKISGEDEEKLDKEFVERKNKLLEADVKFNENKLKNISNRSKAEKDALKETLKGIDEQIDATIRSNEFQGKGGEAQRKGVINRLKKQRQDTIEESAKLAGQLTALANKSGNEITRINKLIITSEVDLTEAISVEAKKQKGIREKRQKELELLRRRLEDLNNNAIEDEFERRTAILKTQSEREIKAIKGFSKIEIALRIALQIKLENDLIKLNESFNAKKDKLSLNAIEDDTERAIRSEQAKSEAIIDTIRKTVPEENAERRRLIDAENKRTEKAVTDILEKKAERELKANIEAIQREADLAKAKFLQKKLGFKDEVEFEKEKNATFEAIDKEALEKELALLEGKNDKASELRREQIKAEIEDLNKFKENSKELEEAFTEAINAIGEFVDDAFTKRLEAIDKQLDAVGNRIDSLRTKANEGQLDAEESLAFEQKREAELERERERTRKRQEQAKAFFTVLTAYQKNDGDIGKTITDIAVLKSLASTFTAYDGVDDTGGRGKVDSKGGKMWTLHPNEQVWSKADRKQVGFRDREEIKNIVGMYDNGTLSNLMKHDKSQEIISPMAFKLNGLSGNGDIVNKLSQLNNSINGIDIPEGMVNIDEVRGLISLISRKGNKKTIERSKLHS